MKITFNWLKEYLEAENLDPEEVSTLLTMSGTEVKKLDYVGERYRNIVIGKIIDFYPHPNADKLSVCKVDIGSKRLNIVCGAKNFDREDKVAVALEGAVVEGQLIRKVNIRGEVSEGMLCSEKELGISNDGSGIMILDQGFVVGESFSRSMGLDDIVIELEITPNRPDCLSVIGVAREVSVLTGAKFVIPWHDRGKEIKLKEDSLDGDLSISIEDYKLCPRYSARIFYDVPKTPSPFWLRNRLILCDLRPVDLIVDLTNYVMLETGQPLHAFDKDLLVSNKIIVRRARSGEKIRTIDDVERILDEDMLVIADERRAVAIAGVMGGKETEINPETHNVLLESANFWGPGIMRTSKKLGLRTEASNRFEKKIDPMLTIFAIKRFEDLLTKITGYKSETSIYDNFRRVQRERKIDLRLAKVKKLLGKELDSHTVSNILKGLGIENTVERDIVKATVPSFRFEDLEREVDLIEEIARIYGYEKFDIIPPVCSLRKGGYSFQQKVIKNLRQTLCDIGLNEVINYSFLSRSLFESFGLHLEKEYSNPVKILNPITEDFELLRSSLLPSMVRNVKNNINHGIKDIRIFEISRIFRKSENSKAPVEKNTLGVILSGRAKAKGWDEEEEFYNYYHLKGILEFISSKFICSDFVINPQEYRFFHPRVSGDVLIEDSKVGIIGKVHPVLLEKMEIEQDIFYLELNLDDFVSKVEFERKFKSIPAYPSVEIDLAIVVDEDVKNYEIEQEIRKSGGKILRNVRLFDVYRGKQIEPGKKSMAYSLVFREEERTLKDREVEIVVEKILDNLKRKFGARLRS
ncbi:MAG: phenylalanine--tRNA ligase subunit beta [Actinobacteria bacterium]|nr:phenylalanine--tRNA ligase subunit beta [Actinomycetota bacterium]